MDPRTSKPLASLPETVPVSVTANPGARAPGLAFLSPPQQPGEIGRLGSYRVLAELGRGGMGVVFLAEETDLKRRVALKVMLPDAAADPRALARFRREAEAQAKVEHDHIIVIHHIGEANGVTFIVMPLLRGQTLSAALKLNPRPPLGELVRIGREIAEGLAAAHAVGLIHRDIKPGNVWLEGNRRRVKILDFGLARTAATAPTLPDVPVTASPKRGDELVTTSGAVMGTPAYMSPEQARGLPTDRRSDLFSLGVVLYQMTTGQRPFTGASAYDVLSAVVAHEPPAVHALVPDAPTALSALIRRLMAKNPAERPPSAGAVAEELAAIERGLVPLPVVVPLSGVPGEPDPWADLGTDDGTSMTEVVRTGAEEPARRGAVPKWPWAAAAAALVVTGAVAVVIWKSAPKSKPDVTASQPSQPSQPSVPPKPPPAAPNDQRAAAEWILLQIGGRRATHVFVLRAAAHKPEQVFDPLKLPAGPFTITGVCLDTILPEHAAELPKAFAALGSLEVLQLSGERWTDDLLATAVGALRDKTAVRNLEIWNVKCPLTKTTQALTRLGTVNALRLSTDAKDAVPMQLACAVPGLSSLQVAGTLTDQSLAPLAELSKLPEVLDLRNNPSLGDRGLEHLGTRPAHAQIKTDIKLNDTAVTEKGVRALAERMPEAKITMPGGPVVGPLGPQRRAAAAKTILDRGGEITLANNVTVKRPDTEILAIGYLRLRSGTFPTPGPATADSPNWDTPAAVTMKEPFSDADLGALRDLNRPVGALILAGQKFSDGGYGELLAYPHFANLASLHVTNCDLSDAAVPAIASRSSLLVLHLVGTKVTDEGVKLLADRLPALQSLRFTNTPITDRSISALSAFQALTALDLKGTAITPAGAKELAAALPYVLIRAPDGTVVPPARKRQTREEAVKKLFDRGARVWLAGTPIEAPAGLGNHGAQISIRLSSGPFNAPATAAGGWDKPGKGGVAEPFDDAELVALIADLKLTELRNVFLNGQKLTDAGFARFLALPAARTIKLLDLTNSALGDETARALAATIPSLESLYLSDTRVTDAGVRQVVAQRPGLFALRLANAAVTDAAIPDLAKLFAATEIDLKGTNATADGAKRLAAALPYAHVRAPDGTVLAPTRKRRSREEAVGHLFARGALVFVAGNPVPGAAALGKATNRITVRLASGKSALPVTPPTAVWERKDQDGDVTQPFDDADLVAVLADVQVHDYFRLCFNRQKVTDAGIAVLATLPAVRAAPTIEITHCDCGDEAVRHLAALPKLTTLYLNGTRVTDAGARHLVARADTLTALRLTDTAVTDAALPDLKKLALLTTLDLKGTKVTEAGARELAAALPRCRIRYGDGKELAPK